MSIQRNYVRFLAPVLLCLSGCWEPVSEWNESPTDGYVPVYAAAEVRQISFEAPRLVRNPGKIYTYGNLLLVNEKKQGIHVFNNEDPLQPIALGFFNILGNSDMAIRNDVLYADHEGNIVGIHMNALNNFTVQGTLPLQNWNYGVPPPRGARFECVDPSNGVVTQWRYKKNQNFDCYAY